MTPLADLQALLERFTAAWQASDSEALRGILHPDCVFVPPGGATRAQGRDACIATYRDFFARAEIVSYKEEPVIDVFERVAIATVGWEMTWRMGGRDESATGRDVLVLETDGTRWQILWRTQS
jgi:uncharacterized protein (TIGR02246 family)